MSYVSALSKNAQAVGLTPGAGSYFSQPSDTLDPRLFVDGQLRLNVRETILQLLFSNLAAHFNHAESWTHAWLAGSGVSYQWEAAREPGDLDCLVGIEYTAFRRTNPEYVGLGNEEIAKMLNEQFLLELWPYTANFMAAYELTFYVNPATNILDINPYAAYDLVNDSWTVEPIRGQVAPHTRQWDTQVNSDYSQAVTIIERYTQALNAVRSSTNPAARTNAERMLALSVDQAADLFDVIHAGRKTAFSMLGHGYGDWHNYRWQAGKKNGSIQALRKIKDARDEAKKTDAAQTYGVELPDARTLTRRAATRGTRK
jgi:hypothetical protein